MAAQRPARRSQIRAQRLRPGGRRVVRGPARLGRTRLRSRPAAGGLGRRSHRRHRMTSTAEGDRLSAARSGGWRQWGPYLSERQWGTVREDYSDNGDAWNYFTHDQARSRAYRWGEDGMAGISDDKGLMCLALSLW